MKYEEGLAKIKQLQKTMDDHAATAGRASDTYTAHMSLFNVAASANDEKGMQEHRDTLHTTVDTILDSGAMIFLLTREMKEVAAKVEFPPFNGFPR